VQAAGDAGQGDVHDRHVEDDHQLRAQHDGERDAAAVTLASGLGWRSGPGRWFR
jgi:hypothetical protein